MGQVLPVYIQGDAPAPIKLRMGNTASQEITTIALRSSNKHGNLTDYLNGDKDLQVEELTLANGAVSTADAAASDGTVARVPAAEATIGTLVSRGTYFQTASALPGLRGTFKVYLRHTSTQADTDVFQLEWGAHSTTALTLNAPTAVSLTATNYKLTSLGTITIEENASSLFLRLYARRSSGTGTIDMDYLVFVPTDEFLTEFTVTTTGSGGYVLLDGEQGAVSLVDADDNFRETASVSGPSNLTLPPGLNLLWMNRRDADTDLIGSGWECKVTYSPRYF